MPGDFYFMKDKFYSDFSDCGLMPNKENIGENTGNRPCFFSFQDKKQNQIYWLVPISSKAEKYQKIYDKNIEKYGRCDFIDFGTVLGTRAAFLIQNIFPATKDYIDSRYVVNGVVVQTDRITTNTVIKKAEDVLEKSKRGLKLTFTDIDKIYSTLLKQIEEKEKTTQIEIEPQRIVGRTENGDVIIKLPGKNPEDVKTQVTLPKGSVTLDKDGTHVIGTTLEQQKKFNFKLPGSQVRRILK